MELSLFPSLNVLHSSEQPMCMLHVNYSLTFTAGNMAFINNSNLTRETDCLTQKDFGPRKKSSTIYSQVLVGERTIQLENYPAWWFTRSSYTFYYFYRDKTSKDKDRKFKSVHHVGFDVREMRTSSFSVQRFSVDRLPSLHCQTNHVSEVQSMLPASLGLPQ